MFGRKGGAKVDAEARERSELEEKFKKELGLAREETDLYKTEVGELNKRLKAKKEAFRKREQYIIKLKGQLEWLQEDRRARIMELALTRIGRGEKATAFACPEAADELMRRYNDSCLENERLHQESIALRNGLKRVSDEYYGAVFESLKAVAEFEKGFSMIYLDSRYRVFSHAGDVGQLFGLKEGESLENVDAESLLRRVPDEPRSHLIKNFKKEDEHYTTVKTGDGRKIDVLLQRVYGPGNVEGGVFVYVREHRFLPRGRGKVVKGVLELFRKSGKELDGLYSEGSGRTLPKPN